MKGLVIKNTGSWYTVKTDDGAIVDSKIKGNFRLKGIRSTNPVAVGDRVEIIRNQEGTAFINAIEDRHNYIIRKSQNLSKQRQGDDRSYLAGAQDIHEASIAFQQKVRNMYLRQAEEDPSFKVLDCRDEDGKMADASVIFNKLKALVDEVL